VLFFGGALLRGGRVEISNEEMTQKSYRAATRHWTQSSFSLHRGSRTKKNIKKCHGSQPTEPTLKTSSIGGAATSLLPAIC
jgi:hypothetical protein